MRLKVTLQTTASIALTGTIFLTACGANDAGSESDTTLRTVGTLPVDSLGTDALDLLMESVEESTEGSVELETYPAGQLYSDEDAVNAIPSGSADAGIVQLDNWSGRVPEVGGLYLPFVYEDNDHLIRAREQMEEHLDEAMQDNANSKIIGWFNYGSVSTMSTEPIESIDDYPGLRFRAFGEYVSNFLDLAGGDSMVMSSADMYDGIQRGTIDGAMSGWASFVDRSLYEVGGYAVDNDQLPVTPFAIVVNLDIWENLDAEQQEALYAAGEEVDDWSFREMETQDQEYREFLRDAGMELIEWDDATFEEAREQVVPGLEDAYLENAGESGEAILEAIEETR